MQGIRSRPPKLIGVSVNDDFDAVRRDPDPIHRGVRAGELIALYQQRMNELARLRRAAIEEAHAELDLDYKDIAEKFGLSKGRITQIRTTAPRPERAFFGVGPVAVGVPRRRGFEEGRERTFVDQADISTRETIQTALEQLSLASTAFYIEPDRADAPAGDAVIICGPKSAPIALSLLAHDPHLDFERDDERWWIRDDSGGHRFDSPYRRLDSVRKDVGYFARHLIDGRIIVHIAGIMSVGSHGVAHWLTANLPTLFKGNEYRSVSGIVECEFDQDFTVTGSRLVAGPYTW